MAQILLDDFCLDLEKCSQIDSTHFLRARFTHGEEIMPFTDLLKISVLCDKQTPANKTYTYENNGWRGELVCPMSGIYIDIIIIVKLVFFTINTYLYECY